MRKMGIGLGVGINRSNYAQGIFNAYSARVVADGGVVESGSCVDAVSSLLQSASLLLIPSGYKGGKLYSEIPTNGNGDLTWTRGSDAFRTNASGVLQRVPWNLLQQSETFANVYWTKLNATISADTTTAPNGTTTADSIIESSSTGIQEIYRTPAPVTAGTFTYSVYVKNFSGTRFLNLSASATASSDYVSVRFSPLTESLSGVVVSGTFSNGSASYTAVGNGWYRVVLTFTTTSLPVPQIALSTDGSIGNVGGYGVQTYTGNGTSGLYIWGAQLVEGTTAQTYLPTTDRLNFPRLSYMYGSCPSALLEPQRTNLVVQSQDFDNASWSKSNATVTANTTTSPDGNTNADTLVRGATTTSESMCRQTTSQANSTAYTLTVYAKQNTSGALLYLRNLAIDQIATTGVVTFALDGTNTITAGTSYTGKATIQSVGNGWYRCSIQGTTQPSIFVNSIDIGCSTNAGLVTGSASASIYLYGAQLEAGAYPTTYIPTTSATATRLSDSLTCSNIYTNGLITSSGGTWFVELKNNVAYTRDLLSRVGIGNTIALTNNSIYLFPDASGRISIGKYLGGAQTTLYTTTTDSVKIAMKWNGSTADVFVNGTKQVSATTFTATLMENLIGGASGIVGTPLFIQQMALYPTPLTDTQCQTLTT